jgi:hypothetical protein
MKVTEPSGLAYKKYNFQPWRGFCTRRSYPPQLIHSCPVFGPKRYGYQSKVSIISNKAAKLKGHALFLQHVCRLFLHILSNLRNEDVHFFRLPAFDSSQEAGESGVEDL